MKYIHSMFRFWSVLLLCCFPFAAFAGDSIKQEKIGIQYEAKIDFPVFEKEPLLNAQVAEIVQQTLNNFNKDFFSTEVPLYPQGFQCIIKNSSVYEDTNYISFLLSVYQYNGGAHGITALIPVNFSKQTKKLLSLQEALLPAKKNWLTALSAEARRLLNEQVQKGEFASNSSWIERGTEPNQENFAVFILEKNAVRITFNQYQVGPYSSGMPEIVIPRTFFK